VKLEAALPDRPGDIVLGVVVVRLAEQQPLRWQRLTAAQTRTEIHAVEFIGVWQTQQRESGGKDVHQRDGRADPQASGQSRSAHDHRYAQHLFVLGTPVEHATVLEELLPVIRYHDDERVPVDTEIFQPLDQATDLIVQLADPRDVEVYQVPEVVRPEAHLAPAYAAKLGRAAVDEPLVGTHEKIVIAGQRPIAAVDVVVVNQQEEAPLSPVLEPVERTVHHARRRLGVVRGLQEGEVVESAVKAVSSVEELGVHDRGGLEAGIAQPLGESLHLFGERFHVSLRAVVPRVESGEQRSVGGQRPGCHGRGILEEHARGSERIESGRAGSIVPVGAQHVGAKGVDRDHHKMLRNRRTITFSAGSHAPQQRRERGQDDELSLHVMHDSLSRW